MEEVTEIIEHLPIDKKNRPVIGITVGDINGIGLEVILKALSHKRMLDICIPVIYGSSKVVLYTMSMPSTSIPAMESSSQ